MMLLVSFSLLQACIAQTPYGDPSCAFNAGVASSTDDDMGLVQSRVGFHNKGKDRHEDVGKTGDAYDAASDVAEDKEAVGRSSGDVRRRRGLTNKIPDDVQTYVLYDTKQKAQNAQGAIPWFNKKITKMGLNSGDGKMVTPQMLGMLAPGSKHLYNNAGAQWLYNYQIVPSSDLINFLNEYKVEFVPMLGFRKVDMLSNAWMPDEWKPQVCGPTYCKGYALAPWDMVPKGFYTECEDKSVCNGETKAQDTKFHMTPQQVTDLTKKVIDELHVKPKFFMGMNEPEDYHLPHKNYSPEEAERMWSKFIQPIGSSLKLTLVSPTINTPGWGGWTGDWFASFLRACYKSRDRQWSPCDIHSIGRISVHYYVCQASEWEEEYAYPNGKFYQNVATELATNIESKKWWLEFLREKKLWVTEFNCNNDNVKGNYCQDKGCSMYTLASHQEQCQRLTGKYPPAQRFGSFEGKYSIRGEGVVRWLENAPNVDRWAWWTTFGGTAKGIAAERQASASLINPTRPGTVSLVKAGDGTKVELKEKARAILMGTQIGGACDFSHCPLSPCFDAQDEPWWKTCKVSECQGCPQCASRR